MRIVVNEQLKDAIEWTCKYASEYKVDIDIHIDADGEISVSVCPTYRDTADTPQTDCDKCIWSVCNYNKVDWDADTPQTESTGSPIGDYRDGVGAWQTDEFKNTDCPWK